MKQNYANGKRIITLIGKIWEKYPQLRFNQLLHILQTGFEDGKWVVKSKKDGFELRLPDLFNVEDDKFEQYLEEVLINGL